jgi:hypothetical protein
MMATLTNDLLVLQKMRTVAFSVNMQPASPRHIELRTRRAARGHGTHRRCRGRETVGTRRWVRAALSVISLTWLDLIRFARVAANNYAHLAAADSH